MCGCSDNNLAQLLILYCLKRYMYILNLVNFKIRFRNVKNNTRLPDCTFPHMSHLSVDGMSSMCCDWMQYSNAVVDGPCPEFGTHIFC